jgi:hypothetical protein
MEKYPKLKSERNCEREMKMMQSLRIAYKQRCLDEREAKRRILSEGGEVA